MIEVAAGVLIDADGRVLLMQRLPGTHLAGLWEFPGGKLEPGETIDAALARELAEELGIDARAFAPVISIPWQYPGKSIRLHALRVIAWHGEPQAREGHPLRWTTLREIDPGAMPPADAPIVTALRLPAFYVISPRLSLPHAATTRIAERGDARLPLPQAASSLGGEGWGEGVGTLSALCQLRMPEPTRDETNRVARRMLEENPAWRESLLINHDIELARELGIGVHLKSAQLRALHARPLPPRAWVGASCHDAEDLALAARLGVDFATLSPVCATASHLDAQPLGWDRFAQLVAGAQLPVYALGGVGPDDLAQARATGAQGVAGIRAFRVP